MPKVLIIEDEENLNRIYQTILKKKGYETLSAFDGQEGLEKAAAGGVDLILLDMRLPKMTGIEFLREAAKNGNLPPTIIFSNQEVTSEIDEAYSLGASRYLLKAWASPNELVSVVKETLG
jgi:two-component system response regulator VicR